MRRIHIVGRKNHGKTTLVVELVKEFVARGMCVGTIKHTHHHHELDTPGKDSHRHRQAGASVVGIASPAMNAVFWPPAYGDSEDAVVDHVGRDEKYDDYRPMYSNCDLVLVEGDSMTNALKLEVWRQAVGSRPIASDDASIVAVISDDDPDVQHVQVWPRSDVSNLADRILKAANSEA